mmetsp:Transcript_66315/g.154042  ORF Transcript_66315/g.154042 Transcript_66315/m.154042 type:complete len:218 (+) Transcript_66315:319-972(+)
MVPFDAQDAFDSEDRAPLRRQLEQGPEPLAQTLLEQLAFPHEGEGVYAAVVAALPVTVTVAMPSAMPAAMPSAMPTPMLIAMPTAIVTLSVALSVALSMAMLLVAFRLSVASASSVIPCMTATMVCLKPSINLSLLLKLNISQAQDVVRADVHKLGDIDTTLDCREDLGKLVDAADTVLASNGCLGAHEIQLVEDDLVSKCNLLVGLVDFPLLDLVI